MYPLYPLLRRHDQSMHIETFAKNRNPNGLQKSGTVLQYLENSLKRSKLICTYNDILRCFLTHKFHFFLDSYTDKFLLLIRLEKLFWSQIVI